MWVRFYKHVCLFSGGISSGLHNDRNGDTANVLIKNPYWSSSPEFIHVKSNRQGTENRLGVEDIRGFGVDDKIYFSAVVDRDVKPREVGFLDNSNKPVLVKDTVFLLVLVRGEKSLYQYQSVIENNNFYIGSREDPQLLVYTKYIREEYDGNYKRENEKYKGQLIYYMNDCMEMIERINKVDYFALDLLEVFEDYYKYCGSEERKDQLKASYPNRKTVAGLLGGLTLAAIDYQGYGLNYPELTNDLPLTFDWTLGLFVDFKFNPDQDHLSFYNELSYTQFSFKEYKLDKSDGEYEYYINRHIENKYVRFNMMLRYCFLREAYDLYVGAGISNNLLVGKKNINEYQKVGLNRQVLYEVRPNTRVYVPGITVGLGANFNKLGFEFRFVRTSPHKDVRYENVKTFMNQYNLLISYKLGKGN